MCINDVKVIDLEVRRGRRYNNCKATAKLECDGGRCQVVTYPVQDDLHLTMLMTDKITGKDVPHFDKFPIRDAILEIVEEGRVS